MTVIKKHHLLRKDLIKHFYYNKRLTLTELSKLTHKSLPLITTTVNSLIEDGYVMEHELAPSTGGRRALTFLLNSQKQRYVVAVAVDQMVTQVVIYDLLNKVKMAPEATELLLVNEPVLVDKFTAFLKDYISRSEIPIAQILGVGIGMPGFVNAEQGVNHSFFKSTGDVSLKKYLTRELGVPVFIDNDSSVIALAELKFGTGKNLKDVLVVNVGWGIGLGMIVNGALFRGHSGYAGEFSHIPLSQSNKICSCGKRGCLEVDTSLVVMVERAKAQMDTGGSSSMELSYTKNGDLPVDQFLHAAKSGDPLAVSILSDAAFLIGKGMSTLIHIMNPKLIVLSGRGAIAGKIFMAPIQQAINEFCIPWLAEQTEIQISTLAPEAELLGAATLVIENCNFN
ncbi:Sugar kinase of the NBD/HSP70 family, may contain an N-terminal HTH domain [Mucilaginibacter pineti]|uniref:Sugar kinase of the NBD/HSP70 family, may contain an N-terminal HTH domain n=1 Tax=Mucilaginibacter pineti TaxID=1391627 RepID=A0A1G6U514_9SPHI|nr:ROK family transcriptional regulator [Mucilaginibacter pineti]SDD36409.1 Sugar kinase of the NBD/HSP70 family, may contain an N-terminal HTH domain [Mucilaginibacter pineti]